MPDLPPEIDTSRPHSARMYDYFIGGKNHFAADRETAAEVLRRSPAAHIAARENRSFLGRAVSYLTARPRNPRFSRAAMCAAGERRSTSAAVLRSAAKWFFPPMK